MLTIKQIGPITYAMGILQEILAATNIIAGSRALPNDVAGCTLEMGADGKWVGTLGSLPKATADALYASGALANLATGATYRDTSGTQYTYGGAGAGWVGGVFYDMPKARLALADVRSGVGNMLINFIGDSHNRGSGQGTGSDGTGSGTKNKWRRNPSCLLSSWLAKQGFYAVNDSVIGSGLLSVYPTTNSELMDFDNRLNLSGSYIYTAQAAGGATFKILSGSGVFTFTPDQAWDSWEVVALVGNGQSGTLTVAISGEISSVNPLAGAANPPAPTKFAGKKLVGGVTSGNIVVTTTANSNLVLVRCWDSTKAKIEILNWACGGAAIADLWPTPSGFNQSQIMGMYSPHLTFIEVFHNDTVQEIPVATWIAGMESLIVAAKVTGDVIMLAGFPGNRTVFDEPNLSIRYDALKALCDTYEVNLIDLRPTIGATYVEVTSNGCAFDTDHWNRRGGGLYAELLFTAFDQVAKKGK